MKQLILIAAAVVTMTSIAHAKNVSLSGAQAESFIERHFPDAEIPGPVKGTFQYVDKRGKTRRGYAECFVPAMGGRSDGLVTTCEVIY